MATERKVLNRKNQLLVALPARVRDHLRAAAGVSLWWRTSRMGEAVLATRDRPARGPERADLDCSSCAARVKELERLRASFAARERTLYAEGHSAGYVLAYERLSNPTGPAAWRANRLAREHQSGTSPSARRKDRRARAVETVAAPPLLDERGQSYQLPPGVVAIDAPLPDADEARENTRASSSPSSE